MVFYSDIFIKVNIGLSLLVEIYNLVNSNQLSYVIDRLSKMKYNHNPNIKAIEYIIPNSNIIF